ncbi:MAG: prepilin peptidase [Pseudomonadota bacterium]
MLDTLTLNLQANPALFVITATVLGLFVGSFLNVVILRLPRMMQREWDEQCRDLLEMDHKPHPPLNLATPRSHCPNCGHTIGAMENLPVLSYLIQRGRCKHCGEPISPRYPLIELFTAVLSGIVAWKMGFGAEALFAILLTWVLVVLTFIDIDHQLLPDSITLPFLWLGLLLSLWGVYVAPDTAIVGAVAGYLSLWLVYQGFKLVTGKEGMGYGDFKLFALFGAWFGWQMLPLIILLSSLVGAVIGIGMILILGRDRQIPIPFGPYLAGAGWLAMLWGPEITQAYLHTLAG